MLKFFHKYQRSVIVYIFISIILLSMLLFGTDMFNTQATQYAIKVNDDEVSYNEVAERKRLVENQMQRQFGSAYESLYEALQKNMEQQVVDSIIEEKLVSQLINKQGLMSHDNRLREAVLGMFGGNFSNATYEAYLRQMGLSASEFEKRLASQVTQQQFLSVMNDFSNASKLEATISAQREEASYDIEYVKFNYADVKKDLAVPADDVLEKYFEENLNKYELAPRVKYSALVVRPEHIMSEIKLSTEDIETYYVEHESEYLNPERVKVAHIQINYGKDSSPDAMNSVREKAEGVRQKVLNGEDFNLLVLQNSDDLITKGISGSLGWIQSGTRKGDALEQAVLKLKEPGVAELIETDYGFHIAKVLEYEAPKAKELKEVEASITKILTELEAPAYALVKAEELAEKFKTSGKSLADFAKENSSFDFVPSTKLLTASEDLTDNLKGLTQKVITDGAGQAQVLVELDKLSILAEIQEYADTEIPSFASVKDKVKEAWLSLTAEEQVKTKANEFFQLAKSAGNLVPVAADSKLKVEEIKSVKSKDSGTGILSNYDIRQAVFKKTTASIIGTGAFKSDDDYIVVAVKQVILPASDKLTKPVDEYLASAKENNLEVLRTALLKDLKAKSEIDIASGILTQ